MKTKRKVNWRKLETIFGVIVLLIALYYIFKEDIYRWSCRSEKIPSSCAIVGIMNEKAGEMSVAIEFYEKSCSMDYHISCGNLAKIFEKSGEKERAAEFYDRACKLGLNSACEKLKQGNL